MTTASVRTVAVTAVLTSGLLMGVAGPAQASCATATPPPSPYRFTGTVLSTAGNGRVARVRTDSGGTVEVDGSPVSTGATSVDRTYTAGARYEFHPLNSSSPYQDNACTATHPLTASDASAPSDGTPPLGGSGDSMSAVHSADTNGQAMLWTSAAVGGLALAATTVIALTRRRRRSGTG